MIRFCDREVGCVEYATLNRSELLSYFLSGHINDVVMVYDSFDTMGYVGKITYHSLLFTINVNGAIQDEYVVLDENIWKNARIFFNKNHEMNGADLLLPVVNESGQVICFAYEDDDANREIRMLRELSDNPEALQFTDIYPEYQCVKLYEFNELAYFFAKYLRGQNVAVQVEGTMWQYYFNGDECELPDYACLSVYAEGIEGKKHSLTENMLRSVSVEFECIDQIYEMNIKKKIFQNADGEWQDLLQRLSDEKEIVIMGSGIEAQKAYGFLKKHGIDICCFMGEQFHKMFGKKILNRFEVQNIYKNPIFIDCTSKGSAWGLGDVDYYDYVGYKRNKRFILLRDYIEVPEGTLIYAIKDRKVVLMGDCYLCQHLSDYLTQNGILVAENLGTLPKENMYEELPEPPACYMDLDVTWLLVAPVTYDYTKIWQKERAEIYFQDKGIDDYSDCFSYVEAYIDVENENFSIRKWLKPKRIVMGSIESYSGNTFIRGLLDEHPSILMICEYGSFNNNLFWICADLSMVDAQDILFSFWNLYGEIAAQAIYNKEAFNEKMEELLKRGDKFTSQELFVMFHMAYTYMDGRNIAEPEISEMVIYWEPHHMPRKIVEDCVRWWSGRTESVMCSILNVVRNMCMKIGSRVKDTVLRKQAETNAHVLEYYPVNKKIYAHVDRVIVRFEDLKCSPRETLLTICNTWGIPWSESLMLTTSHGKKEAYYNGERMVSDFDLEPVYNTYDKYLSVLDRMRIMIINAPWQREYGYPYVEMAQFSRRELQEMFLKQFRFEDLTKTDTDGVVKIRMQKIIRAYLQEVRMQTAYRDM